MPGNKSDEIIEILNSARYEQQ